MIQRELEQRIRSLENRGKAIIIMGARQVGKSTLLKEMFGGKEDAMWLNADEPDVRNIFTDITSTRLRAFFGSKKIVIIDEAQRIPDVGIKLKLITDEMKDIRLIATGSSSFELASKTSESLAGRKREFRMYPLSFGEMVEHTSLLEENRMLPHRLVFGYYPEVVTHPGEERALLQELVDSYLYKDLLSLDGIKKPDKLVKLLQALALQVGSQVSFNEVGQMVGLDTKTVERYIDALEKCYVIFHLPSFSRNVRNELKSSRKIYFYDNGILNAVVSNYTQIENRPPKEAGSLWENFVISERIKRNEYSDRFCSQWFWRTQQQKEIDYLEVSDGKISAYEFKWSPAAKYKRPETFIKAYPDSTLQVIHRDNMAEFLL